ncbi:MAG: UDP-N-acetylmuramoyl-tripeptide--D-alanyl-D-alanine ligase, partial [Verrucomicrobia bacterium]|nr:UDP-N-acetylmuramoyl-tripeptide--D-alanyl-D-alanine ligase [Verrucomicrobiota bacterium]
GAEVENSGVDLLVTVGELPALIAAGVGADVEIKSFENCDQAGLFLKQQLKSGDLLLVKGSRSAGMEKVIERLTD